jgi:hypothetical protein
MQRKYGRFQDSEGRGYPGASVVVYLAGTSTLATLYSPSGSITNPSGLANPFTTDSLGNYGFAIGNGTYDIQLSGGGMPTEYITNLTIGTTDITSIEASSVTNVPAGTIAATNVQAALNELGTEKASLLDLADTATVSLGDAMVGVKSTLTGATATTQHNINEQRRSVFDWMTAAQIADVQAGTLLVDVIVPIQAAVDACIVSQQKLFFPVGNYSISKPIEVWKWSGAAFTFVAFEMEGEKSSFTNHQPYLACSTITPTFSTLPAVMVQQARAFSMKNIYLDGTNTITIGDSPPFSGLFTNANYVTGTCRDSRYSPYAGVCIDPFGTSVPADGGYTGYSGYYVATNVGSMKAKLESCSVREFVVAFMLSPNGQTANCEDITFYDCKTLYNKVAIAIGQSQSRNVNVYNLTSWFHLIAFDGMTYGSRTGYCPNIFGANISFVKYIFNTTASYMATLCVNGLYSESLGSIGFINPSAAIISNGMVMSGCTFAFLQVDNVSPDHHLTAYAPVTFIGCNFNFSRQNVPYRFLHYWPYAPLTFTGCAFKAFDKEPNFAMSGIGSGAAYSDVVFNNCVLSLGTSLQSYSNYTKSYIITNYDKKYVTNGALLQVQNSGANLLYMVASNEKTLSLGSVAITISGANATFTVADGTIVRVGDTIINTTATNYEGPLMTAAIADSWNAVGIVTNVNGNDITVTGLPQTLVNGTYALYKTWGAKCHSATTGDTHSNTTVDNVANYAAWAIGDPITGTGIPAGTYVTNIVTTTFTISKAATATAAGVRLYDADLYKFTGTAV